MTPRNAIGAPHNFGKLPATPDHKGCFEISNLRAAESRFSPYRYVFSYTTGKIALSP